MSSEGSAKKIRKIVTMIGRPRQISMYRRISARSGQKWIVISVPSSTPTIALAATDSPAMISVPRSPSVRM